MRTILILILASLTGVALAACGDSGSSETQVVATTGIAYSLVEQLAGEDAEVVQLIPDSASPHEFSLSAEDRQQLEEADLIVYNGAGLEAGVPVDEADSPKWALTEHVGALLPRSEDGHETAGAAAPAGALDADPHVWMDPTRTAEALPSLASALAEADPDHAGDYRRRAGAFAKRLARLDEEVSRSLSTLPPDSRELVTSHDALGYFADRYGLEVVATAFPASGGEAEPSAEGLAEVEQAVRETGVPAVFAEETDDPRVLERVASDTGVEIVTDLLVESPGRTGSYEAMLRHDAQRIASALGG